MIKIFIGLIVLSIMVFIHELGHFIAAKLCGVDVESFSIGWGPVLLRKKIGQTEYRLSAIPLGGYCGMKNENAFKKALEEKLSYIPKEEGGLYSARPLCRILIAFAGPFANYLTAAIAFAVVSAIGYTYYTQKNIIAPVYYYETSAEPSPAKTADLRMGDKIIEIDGTKTETFSDIIKTVLPSAGKELTVKIERSGEILTKKITPALDKKTGAGVIGFYPFVIPKAAKIEKNSAAEIAGIKTGDIITAINGKKILNTVDFAAQLEKITEDSGNAPAEIALTYNRNGKELETLLEIKAEKQGLNKTGLGILFETIKIEIKGTGFFSSLKNGFAETHNSVVLTFKSLRLFFKGIDLRQAVSGPLRITHMIGEAAHQSFKEGFAAGLTGLLSFVAIISISLFIMNLLPIPILDGGLILLSLIEIIMRREIHPKIIYCVQFAGFIFIGALLILGLTGDILFFIKK